MAFLIPDNARSRKDIAAPMRRVAGALAMALEDDATVWFEPPYDTTGQRPDFVVIDPRLGVAILEVFDGKDDATLLGAVHGRIRVEVEGQEEERVSPLDRAVRFAGDLTKLAADRPGLDDVPMVPIAVFTGIDRQAAKELCVDEVVDLSSCIFRNEFKAAVDGDFMPLQRALNRAFGGELDDELEQPQIDELRAILHPDLVISAAPQEMALFSAGATGDGDVIKVMDRKQEALAKGLGSGHRVIRGVAGSGKTLVLVHRARLLSRAMPNRRILVTCFNRSLASQLKNQLAECSNVEVIHLDSLMAKAIYKAGLQHPGYGDGGVEARKRALESITKIGGHSYRAVMIDEAQDFDNDALRFCLQLLESGDPQDQDLVIVADSAQNIYRTDFRWKDVGIQAQGRTKILRLNYRNTREILQFAHDFLTADPGVAAQMDADGGDDAAIIPAEAAERSGPEPTVIITPSADVEIAAVLAEVKQRYRANLPSRSIAVLLGRQGGRPFVEALIHALEREGLPVFWATKDADAKDRIGAADEPIVVSTIHSAKGLEFPDVIVCGLGGENETGEELTATRKLLYVGFTRAIERLTVMANTATPFISSLIHKAGS